MPTLPPLTPVTCSDCGVPEGAFHVPYCDQAVCNRCGGQYLSCDCAPRQKRRVRFIAYPHHCARCGIPWPDFFGVADKDWAATVQHDQRDAILCRPCFDTIRQLLGLPPCVVTSYAADPVPEDDEPQEALTVDRMQQELRLCYATASLAESCILTAHRSTANHNLFAQRNTHD